MSDKLDLANSRANKRMAAERAEAQKKYAATKQRLRNHVSKEERMGTPTMASVKGRSALDLSEGFNLKQLQSLYDKATDPKVKARLTRAINKRRSKSRRSK